MRDFETVMKYVHLSNGLRWYTLKTILPKLKSIKAEEKNSNSNWNIFELWKAIYASLLKLEEPLKYGWSRGNDNLYSYRSHTKKWMEQEALQLLYHLHNTLDNNQADTPDVKSSEQPHIVKSPENQCNIYFFLTN